MRRSRVGLGALILLILSSRASAIEYCTSDPKFPHVSNIESILNQENILAIRSLGFRNPQERVNRCSERDRLLDWRQSNDQPISFGDSDQNSWLRRCEFASRSAAAAEFIWETKYGSLKNACPQGCEPGLWLDYQVANGLTGSSYRCAYQSTISCLQIDQSFRACGSIAAGAWVISKALSGRVSSLNPESLPALARSECLNRFGTHIQNTQNPRMAYAQFLGGPQGLARCAWPRCEGRVKVPDNVMGGRQNNDLQPLFQCATGQPRKLSCNANNQCTWEMYFEVQLFKTEECHLRAGQQ